MMFYGDGVPALEKKETHRERDEKRVKTLKTAEVAIETLSDRVSQGKPLTKEMFKDVEKGLRADIAIAADCQPEDIVLSHDSDFFSYDPVNTIWRPVGKRDESKVLEYNREAVLAQTGLSTTKLIALACVSCNDYNKNIPSLRIATNYNITKALSDAGKNKCLAMEPYTAEQEARYQQSIAEAKRRKAAKKRQREARRLKTGKEQAKKPPLKIDEIDKKQLINTMVYEHPHVSLPVGTVKANSKRAAAATTTNANQLPSSEQQQQQEVSACILDIVGQVRVTKRHAQEFLGAFIETIFERGLAETDRTIMYSLCPAVESKTRVAPQLNQDSQASSSGSAGTPAENEGEEVTENDGDEDAEPSAMDKPFIIFYQILLAHIYSHKIKSKTVAERQVGQLLARATLLGMTFPPVPLRNISYPTNGLLESTSKQLYRSIKMMYRNGSVALEKKINPQADGQSGTVLSKIDSKLPAIENYLLLNKASGGSRCIAPSSPLAAHYVDFSERHLLPLFYSGSGSSGREAGGPSSEAMDCIGDGSGGSGGGEAAAASLLMAAATNAGDSTKKRRAASIVLVEVPNTDVDPKVDAPRSSSGRTKNKTRKE
ncbi:hypothetical protein BGZ47_004957 [Haplosporangium gracile]|nr:hypothetical protein BGZ47_004957 [Haplosporangium gracile]